MKNKRVKKMLHTGYCTLSGKYFDNFDPVKYQWAFDRLRLLDMNMNRKQLRHAHLSQISLTANQLKGK